jgi:hypothetical protein
MKVTANIATYPLRMESLKKMIPTIIDQFDEINICLNQYNAAPDFLQHEKINVVIPKDNLTDNGKFLFLVKADPEELYCTLDDDILYPSDYRKTLERNHRLYPDHVLTFHGRVLQGKFNRYYKAPHKVYRVLGDVKYDFRVDICGTGVSAFKPFDGAADVAINKLQKMSDIIFSLHCAFNKKPIICLNHKMGWVKHIDNDITIYDQESKNDFRQAILCQKIYDLNRQ